VKPIVHHTHGQRDCHRFREYDAMVFLSELSEALIAIPFCSLMLYRGFVFPSSGSPFILQDETRLATIYGFVARPAAFSFASSNSRLVAYSAAALTGATIMACRMCPEPAGAIYQKVNTERYPIPETPAPDADLACRAELQLSA